MKRESSVQRENGSKIRPGTAEALIDSSIDAIIAIDNARKVIAWNHAAEIIYGKTKAEVLGNCFTEIFPDLLKDEETCKAIDMAFKGFKAFVPSSMLYLHRRHIENHYTPLRNESGITGVMNIVHDVAHRIKTEERLRQLNKQLEKRNQLLKTTADEMASFAYITSTKIKEPVRQIYTGIEHLINTEAGRLTNNGKATFRRMQSSINRMDLLINDILSLSQISILEKTDKLVNLDELLPDVVKNLEKKTEEKKATVIIKDLCAVQGHEKYLHLLFYHLLNNALKFNDNPKPLITADCKTIVINENIGMITDERKYHRITISDNGIGIAAGDEAKIFNMFEKLHPDKYKGSGMGLTIARKIMDAHDGFIQVESRLGQGSAFHCFFPIA